MTQGPGSFPGELVHSVTAIPGHVGYPPGHEKNPYTSLGLWYYVPVYNALHYEEAASAAPIDRSLPYFGLSNPEDFLRDRAMHGPLLDPDGNPVLLDGEPVQRTLPGSGAISMNQIHALFGWGNNLAAYRGRRWYRDDGSYGDFPTGAISLQSFYGKRPDDPVTPGSWDMTSTGYWDFYTPVHRSISVQRMGAGGGGGAMNAGGTGEQTWAFSGGSPANGGGGGGRAALGGGNYVYDAYYGGGGGAWGAAGNANNIQGEGGQLCPATVTNPMDWPTGRGGNSAWGGGGPAVSLTTFANPGQAWNGNAGSFGSGGGGGGYFNGAVLFDGCGGGGGGYTLDNFGQGVIGGVVSTYVGNGAGGGDGIGGRGGTGRIYVNWG